MWREEREGEVSEKGAGERRDWGRAAVQCSAGLGELPVAHSIGVGRGCLVLVQLPTASARGGNVHYGRWEAPAASAHQWALFLASCWRCAAGGSSSVVCSGVLGGVEVGPRIAPELPSIRYCADERRQLQLEPDPSSLDQCTVLCC